MGGCRQNNIFALNLLSLASLLNSIKAFISLSVIIYLRGSLFERKDGRNLYEPEGLL